MFDTIQALIEQKQANRPILSKTWEHLVEHLGPLDIRTNILAYYHTEFGNYANLALLTKTLVVDLETNEQTQVQGLFTIDLNTVGGVSISNVPDTLTEPISTIAAGATKNPTLSGSLLTIEGDKFVSWFAIKEEEDELRKFLMTISTTRFSQ